MNKFEYTSYVETTFMRIYTNNVIKAAIPDWIKLCERYAIKWMFKNADYLSVRLAEILCNDKGLVFKPESVSDDGEFLEVRIYLKDGQTKTLDEIRRIQLEEGYVL